MFIVCLLNWLMLIMNYDDIHRCVTLWMDSSVKFVTITSRMLLQFPDFLHSIGEHGEFQRFVSNRDAFEQNKMQGEKMCFIFVFDLCL